MATPTERVRQEIEKGKRITTSSPSELRKMLKYAREQFMRSWALKDAIFWKKRMEELKAELERR